MKLVVFALFIFYSIVACGQTPLEMDSTVNFVYYAEFPLEKGKEAKAEDIFTRFINLNFNIHGSAIFFKNPVTHKFSAKCYFDIKVQHLPTPADGKFIWYFSIVDGKILIYLYNIYYQSLQNNTMDSPALMSAEWINDYEKSSILVGHVSEKIDAQMKYYIKIFKESLSLLDK